MKMTMKPNPLTEFDMDKVCEVALKNPNLTIDEAMQIVYPNVRWKFVVPENPGCHSTK